MRLDLEGASDISGACYVSTLVQAMIPRHLMPSQTRNRQVNLVEADWLSYLLTEVTTNQRLATDIVATFISNRMVVVVTKLGTAKLKLSAMYL